MLDRYRRRATIPSVAIVTDLLTEIAALDELNKRWDKRAMALEVRVKELEHAFRLVTHQDAPTEVERLNRMAEAWGQTVGELESDKDDAESTANELSRAIEAIAAAVNLDLYKDDRVGLFDGEEKWLIGDARDAIIHDIADRTMPKAVPHPTEAPEVPQGPQGPEQEKEMSRRIHLREYSEAELRAMEAGPLLDWLVAQAMGRKVERALTLSGAYKTSDRGAYWWDNSNVPDDWGPGDRFSRDWSAAGRALEWLAANGVSISLDCLTTPNISSTHVQGRVPKTVWRVFRNEEDPALAVAPTPQLAVARAVAVVGRRRIGK